MNDFLVFMRLIFLLGSFVLLIGLIAFEDFGLDANLLVI